MLFGEKRVFSMTSLFLADHIAQADMGKIIRQWMSGKRDVEEEVATIFLIQVKGEVEEKKVVRRMWIEFRPDWLNRGAVSKGMKGHFGGGGVR